MSQSASPRNRSSRRSRLPPTATERAGARAAEAGARSAGCNAERAWSIDKKSAVLSAERIRVSLASAAKTSALLRRLACDRLRRTDHEVREQAADAVMHALDRAVVAHRLEIEHPFIVPVFHDAHAVEQRNVAVFRNHAHCIR